MLIIDRHISHVSLEFINFCINNQIVAFCLSPYTTDILQTLNIRSFRPFHNYTRWWLKENANIELDGQSIKPVFFNIILKLGKKSYHQKLFYLLEQLLLQFFMIPNK